MAHSREQHNSNREGRMLNYSDSTSNLHSSLEPERSTPSYNHASSRCPEPFSNPENTLGECMELNVRTIWLETKDSQRYLLLEDTDTGDILMPQTKMKDLLGDNYSRLLNNSDNRFVMNNPTEEFGLNNYPSSLYWVWPFESPPNVKSLIRRELQDHSTGQIRLVLLPIVYNTLSKILTDSQAKKTADHRVKPSFLALEKALNAALRNSSYAALLHLPDHGTSADGVDDRNGELVLFNGPFSVPMTAKKYMSPIRACSRKKAKMDTQGTLLATSQQGLRGVAELNAEMQQVHERIDWQAKRIDALEETLQDTKNVFTQLFQFLTAGEQPNPMLTNLAPTAPPTEWNPTVLTSGQAAQNMPKHNDSAWEFFVKSGFVRFSPGAADAIVHEPMVPTGPQQSPVVGGMVGASPSGSSNNPGQNILYPTAACKAHHLTFPSPQTPNLQGSAFLTDSMFSGHGNLSSSDSTTMMTTPLQSMSPAYTDYRRPPFNRGESRPLEMPPMN